jgi:uncharacterized repeat protein (TIGR03803 family)
MTGVSAGASTFSVLHNFDQSGYSTVGNLIFDTNGNIYGTAAWGGLANPNCFENCGVVFKLSPNGGSWNFEIIYSFTGGADGGQPHGRLTLDSKGNLYGTTYYGGTVNLNCPKGCGTVFELSPSGSAWTFVLLHSFSGSDGSAPETGLTPDRAGNLYGTTSQGNNGGANTVFELSPSGGGWTFSNLYTFPNSGSEGLSPFSDLAIDGKGNLYGATQQGGSFRPGCYGCGTVFKLSPSNGSWKFSLLHTFQGYLYKDGAHPWGSLFLDGAGNLYGTTFEGGATCDCGTVFKLSQSAGKWKEQVLHRFTGPPGHYGPLGGVTMDKAGNLFSTTISSAVFRLAPQPKGGWKYTFYTLTSDIGIQPYAGVIADALGNLYGTTTIGGISSDGTVFELSAP